MAPPGLFYPESFHLKPRNAREVDQVHTESFAAKEYIQNVEAQFMDAQQTTEPVRRWHVTDLTAASRQVRRVKRGRLLTQWPEVFVGEYGQAIKAAADLTPRYILEAHMRLEEMPQPRFDHDLDAVIILWQYGESGLTALTFYNNYLNPNATFSHFVDDGASTNSDSDYAVGFWGKGFPLATQFLVQRCSAFGAKSGTASQDKELANFAKHNGVELRVGSQLGQTDWQKNRRSGNETLIFKMRDYRLMSRGSLAAEFAAMDKTVPDEQKLVQLLERNKESRRKLGLLAPRHVRKDMHQDKKRKLSTSQDAHLLRHEDQVCIHVVGLPPGMTGSKLFSGVYGMVERPNSWAIRDPRFPLIEFFVLDRSTEEGRMSFFLRDQYVPREAGLGDLGINYQGYLKVTSDRTQIRTHNRHHQQFTRAVENALNLGILRFPDLAVRICRWYLSTDRPEFQPVVSQSDDHSRQAYLIAYRSQKDFNAYPVRKAAYRAKGALLRDLIKQFNFVPDELTDEQVTLLESSGAFVPLEDYAVDMFKQAPIVPFKDVLGHEHLEACLKDLYPEETFDLVVRKAAYDYPRVLLEGKQLTLAEPGHPKPCNVCANGQCMCWLGPILLAVNDKVMRSVPKANIFRVFEAAVHRWTKASRGTRGAVTPPKSASIHSQETVFEAAARRSSSVTNGARGALVPSNSALNHTEETISSARATPILAIEGAQGMTGPSNNGADLVHNTNEVMIDAGEEHDEEQEEEEEDYVEEAEEYCFAHAEGDDQDQNFELSLVRNIVNEQKKKKDLALHLLQRMEEIERELDQRRLETDQEILDLRGQLNAVKESVHWHKQQLREYQAAH